jgi:thymidylate synthase
MNNIDRQYKELLDYILHFGVDKADRTGTGTKSIFGWQIRHNMKEGFPLLTTKKVAFKTMVTELLWFLRGDTNIKFLHDNNCHIWDGDYEKSGRTDGELGPIYGRQWRMWPTEWDPIDQIQNLINELKTNPDSRRLMVSAWNVGELDQMVLPPCHYSFQCYVRDGKYLSLMWNQRSVDTFLGLPFNIASYALLLEIIAKAVDMIPDELIGNLGDVHLYNNHIEQAKEQITRTPFELSKLIINSGNENWHLLEVDEIINTFDVDITFKVENYQSHPAIKAPLSN